MAKLKRIYLTIFFVLQACVFLPIVFGVGDVSLVAYGAILLCFATSIILLQKNIHSVLQFVALLFTACADYLLILKGGANKDLAMCFFIVTQIAYGLRTLYMAKSKREFDINLVTRLVLCVSLVAGCLFVLDDTPDFVWLSMIYFANLITNVIFALYHFEQNKLLAVGLLLFICCDVFVGLAEMPALFGWGEQHFVSKLSLLPVSMHSIFYHPSQALLCVSANNKKTSV